MQIAVALALMALGALMIWRRGRRVEPAPERLIVVDGTNVLFWDDNIARLATLQRVVKHLQVKGFAPVVFLDASSRHHIGDTSLSPHRFKQALGVTKNQIHVCPKGTEADSYILDFAQEHNVAVVTNDRFRDRPQAARNVRLIKGHFRGSKLVLKGL